MRLDSLPSLGMRLDSLDVSSIDTHCQPWWKQRRLRGREGEGGEEKRDEGVNGGEVRKGGGGGEGRRGRG